MKNIFYETSMGLYKVFMNNLLEVDTFDRAKFTGKNFSHTSLVGSSSNVPLFKTMYVHYLNEELLP